jgi:hypothetical protein
VKDDTAISKGNQMAVVTYLAEYLTNDFEAGWVSRECEEGWHLSPATVPEQYVPTHHRLRLRALEDDSADFLEIRISGATFDESSLLQIAESIYAQFELLTQVLPPSASEASAKESVADAGGSDSRNGPEAPG